MELISWLDDPRPDRGVTFVGRRRTERWSYAELARLVACERDALARRGVGPGGVVGLALPCGPDFVATFFGALLVGAAANPLPLALVETAGSRRDRFSSLIDITRPDVICADERLRDDLRDAVEALPDVDSALVWRDGSAERPAAAAATARDHLAGAAPALLQFTSGSTGRPRAVELTLANVTANVTAIRRWLGMGDGETTVTWLPTYHDMGLIGAVLTPIATQTDLVVMQPGHFVRRPLDWLRCVAQHRATIGVAPAFALQVVLRGLQRAGRLDLGPDAFQAWRTLIVGAERIDAALMDRFVAALRPHGLRAEALTPAYGLAEATLAVTGTGVADAPSLLAVDPTTLVVGRRVRAEPAGEAEECAAPERVLVGCGPPVAGTEVTIAHRGRPLPDGHLGEIRVRGPGVASRYLTGPGRTEPIGEGLGLATGDLGVLRNGHLYVVGRAADWLAGGDGTAGISLEALDGIAATVPGAAIGQYACVADVADGRHVVLVAEAPDDRWLQAATARLREHLPPAITISSRAVPPGTILRTTSGKVRRGPLADALAARPQRS